MKEGWEVRPIKEVSFIQEGPGIRKYEYQENGYPMINVRCVQDGFIDMKKSKSAKLELALGKWKHFQVIEGDILFTISGTIGRCAVAKKDDLPLLMNTSVVRFRSIVPELNNEFLYYYLTSDGFQSPLNNLAGGTAIRNVGPTHIKTLNIPLPPLAEQKRIVVVLDEAFEGIELALAAATKNLKNARELFETTLNTTFSQKGEGWVEASLVSASHIINGFAFKSGDFRSENLVKAIKITNVGVKSFVENDESNLPESFLQKFPNHVILSGDIVMALTRTIITGGLKVAVVPSEYNHSLINQRVAAIRAQEEVLEQSFLYYFLGSKIVSNYVLERVNTLMQPNLSINDLKQLPVPCPPLTEQKRILRKLDKCWDETQRLETLYQKKIDTLNELKQSLLQKAFAGELTAEPQPLEATG